MFLPKFARLSYSMASVALPRDESPNVTPAPSVSKGVYIAGFTVAGLLVTIVFLWIYLRYRRHRMNERRCEERGGAFLHVRGVVRSTEECRTLDVFSRDRMTSSVILPEKTLTRKPISPGSSGKTPISSSPLDSSLPFLSPHPRSHAVASSEPSQSRYMSILNPAHPRHSRSSSGFSGYSQVPFLPPGLHSRDLSASSTSSSQARPVRQLFEPVLPDELSLARYGEHLTVLHSFDDGWCLIARDTSRSSRSSAFSPSRLSTRMKNGGDNIELGLVPAWVFLKPMKGLAAERPVRSLSVNALQCNQESKVPSRDTVISWSNFA